MRVVSYKSRVGLTLGSGVQDEVSYESVVDRSMLVRISPNMLS